jgi:cGMP-dependent protein kinase
VKSGKVDVFKNRAKIRTITKNDYFGERAIIFNDFRSASVVAVGQVECWTISKEEFLGLMDESIRGQLLSRIELQDDQVDWDMMKISKLLGTGMFGNVYLAVHQEKRTLYALKTVTRNKIEKYQI